MNKKICIDFSQSSIDDFINCLQLQKHRLLLYFIIEYKRLRWIETKRRLTFKVLHLLTK